MQEAATWGEKNNSFWFLIRFSWVYSNVCRIIFVVHNEPFWTSSFLFVFSISSWYFQAKMTFRKKANKTHTASSLAGTEDVQRRKERADVQPVLFEVLHLTAALFKCDFLRRLHRLPPNYFTNWGLPSAPNVCFCLSSTSGRWARQSFSLFSYNQAAAQNRGTEMIMYIICMWVDSKRRVSLGQLLFIRQNKHGRLLNTTTKLICCRIFLLHSSEQRLPAELIHKVYLKS